MLSVILLHIAASIFVLQPPDNQHLPTIFLKLPVSVVQRTDLSGLQPSRDAVEMEGVLIEP